MGNKVEIYANTEEDFLEKSVKKGYQLKEVLMKTNSSSVNQVCSITLEPNKWNIIHLICWYNNFNLLEELIGNSTFDKKYLNSPDINLEPPIAICCVVDAVDCLKILIDNGAIKSFTNEDKNYRVRIYIKEIGWFKLK